MKPKNLTSWKNFASFDTMIVIESTKVVEIEIISKIVSLAMILRSNIPMWQKSKEVYLVGQFKAPKEEREEIAHRKSNKVENLLKCAEYQS